MSGVQFTVLIVGFILFCSWRNAVGVALDDTDAATLEAEEHQAFMEAFATFGTTIKAQGLRGAEKVPPVGRKRIVPRMVQVDEESMSLSVSFPNDESLSLSLDDARESLSFSFSFSEDLSVSFDTGMLFDRMMEKSMSVSMSFPPFEMNSLSLEPSMSLPNEFSMVESFSFSAVDPFEPESVSFSFPLKESISFDPDMVFEQGTEESISLSLSLSLEPFPEESISFSMPSPEESISFSMPSPEESISMLFPEDSISFSMPSPEESISFSMPIEESLSFDPFPPQPESLSLDASLSMEFEEELLSLDLGGGDEEEFLSFDVGGGDEAESLSFSLSLLDPDEDPTGLTVFEDDDETSSSEDDDETSSSEDDDTNFSDAIDAGNFTQFGDVAVQGEASAENGVVRRIRRRRLHGLTGRPKLL